MRTGCEPCPAAASRVVIAVGAFRCSISCAFPREPLRDEVIRRRQVRVRSLLVEVVGLPGQDFFAGYLPSHQYQSVSFAMLRRVVLLLSVGPGWWSPADPFPDR